MERINPEFKQTDAVLVVGANDVVNPAADDPTSPIAGMPILEVFNAQTVMVIKRSLSPGFAGIKNDLFENDNTMMGLRRRQGGAAGPGGGDEGDRGGGLSRPQSAVQVSRHLVVAGLSLAWALSLPGAGPAAGASSAPARGSGGGVSSAEAAATEVGLEILRSGGNAVDAAVATALALVVVHPQAGNLGGGGFALVRIEGEIYSLDFRETAPAAASETMYLDDSGAKISRSSWVGAVGLRYARFAPRSVGVASPPWTTRVAAGRRTGDRTSARIHRFPTPRALHRKFPEAAGELRYDSRRLAA